MNKLFGYAGNILRINLATGKSRIEPLSEDYAANYIGGIGLGMRLLLDNSKPGVDAFSEENPLILATGPLSGTIAPTGRPRRTAVVDGQVGRVRWRCARCS